MPGGQSIPDIPSHRGTFGRVEIIRNGTGHNLQINRG
jgi:hypothetical protein